MLFVDLESFVDSDSVDLDFLGDGILGVFATEGFGLISCSVSRLSEVVESFLLDPKTDDKNWMVVGDGILISRINT